MYTRSEHSGQKDRKDKLAVKRRACHAIEDVAWRDHVTEATALSCKAIAITSHCPYNGVCTTLVYSLSQSMRYV